MIFRADALDNMKKGAKYLASHYDTNILLRIYAAKTLTGPERPFAANGSFRITDAQNCGAVVVTVTAILIC